MSVTTERDDDVVEAIPVEVGVASTAMSIGAWMLVILAAIGVVWFAWSQLFDPGGGGIVEQYVDEEVGERYVSREDKFTAVFPTKPTRREEPGPKGPGAVITSRPGSDYVFSVSWQTESDEALEDAAGTLDIAAGNLAASGNGEIVEQKESVTFLDVEVKDLVWRVGDTWYRTTLVLSVDRLYTIQVASPNDDPAPWKRFVPTFKRLAG